jgi:hypothetical protein
MTDAEVKRALKDAEAALGSNLSDHIDLTKDRAAYNVSFALAHIVSVLGHVVERLDSIERRQRNP